MKDKLQLNEPSARQISRWRRYLANERAEAAVYRELAHKRTGEDREILLALADAESRHELYWRERLGEHVGMPRSPDFHTRVMGFLARHFGTVFALVLMQNAETRNPYINDEDAPDEIVADERIHAEVMRALAAKGRQRMAGGFRAAVFGANDGIVSNVALILGVLGSGMPSPVILITGVSGLLAGAFSMAAGEYISVRSQDELLDASTPHPKAHTLIDQVDVDANELALVYRARGFSAEEAERKAGEVFDEKNQQAENPLRSDADKGERSTSKSALTAAGSSFVAFSIGAVIPIIPFMFGMAPLSGGILALALSAIALLFTGGITGLVSDKPMMSRALRQLGVGMAAAVVTFLLGLAFGSFLG